MADVLVVFGSDSDKPVYSGVMSGLKERGISASLRICSAHRTPEMLDSVLKGSKAKIIIAGAGLSAALPGAIASKTIKPVIGVPVGTNYAGLDALLSVAQMPPGFPVITAPVNGAETAVAAAELALQQHLNVKVSGNKFNKAIKARIEKAVETAKELGLAFEFIEETASGKFNPKQEILVQAIEFGCFTPPKLQEALALNVPVLQESGGPEALEFLGKCQNSLWLGLNRMDNAIIAAAQLLNIHGGKFSEKLQQQRRALRNKVIEADKKESVK